VRTALEVDKIAYACVEVVEADDEGFEVISEMRR